MHIIPTSVRAERITRLINDGRSIGAIVNRLVCVCLLFTLVYLVFWCQCENGTHVITNADVLRERILISAEIGRCPSSRKGIRSWTRFDDVGVLISNR